MCLGVCHSEVRPHTGDVGRRDVSIQNGDCRSVGCWLLGYGVLWVAGEVGLRWCGAALSVSVSHNGYKLGGGRESGEAGSRV